MHHKATGLAKIRVDGKDIYLGKYGTPESKARYEQECKKLLVGTPSDESRFTCNELALRFTAHAERYYVKDGKPTSEVRVLKSAIAMLVATHGKTLAINFGPVALGDVRDAMIAADWVRTSINGQIDRLRRVFRWASEKELIPASIWHGLRSLKGLTRGRYAVKESGPVRPVNWKHVDAIQPHCGPLLWGMIQTQKLTGMRPGELVIMRPCDIDRSEDVWIYTPSAHKTEHHDKTRLIAIGPRCQAVLQPFLDATQPTQFVFRPQDRLREYRGENCKPDPRLNDCYSTGTYSRAIARVLDRAGIPHWHPHQLRHSRATELRAKVGLEKTQPVMGHENANMTERYAEQDLNTAIEVMRAHG